MHAADTTAAVIYRCMLYHSPVPSVCFLSIKSPLLSLSVIYFFSALLAVWYHMIRCICYSSSSRLYTIREQTTAPIICLLSALSAGSRGSSSSIYLLIGLHRDMRDTVCRLVDAHLPLTHRLLYSTISARLLKAVRTPQPLGRECKG